MIGAYISKFCKLGDASSVDKAYFIFPAVAAYFFVSVFVLYLYSCVQINYFFFYFIHWFVSLYEIID